MQHKIIFFDVDGTLTSYKDGTISTATKQALAKLKKNGFIIVAATGRPFSMCHELIALGIDTFITANGGYVIHKNRCIHKIKMNQNIVQQVSHFALQQQHALTYYSHILQMNTIQTPIVQQALYETLGLCTFPPIAQNNDSLETYLLCLFVTDEQLAPYKKQFPALTFRRWHTNIVNVLERNVSKSDAIMQVLQHFGLSNTQAIAFGDGNNDIDMLQIADIGIAMGNATENLKAISNFVTEDSHEDGIVLALKHYKLI